MVMDQRSKCEKEVKIYADDHVIKSEKYFNQNKPITVRGLGLFNTKRNKHADLHLHFTVEFTDSEKLTKYNDIMQKILKTNSSTVSPQTTGASDNKKVINIHSV